MKSVCVKHEQAFETECPWCETERVEETKPDGGTVIHVPGFDPSAQRATFTWTADGQNWPSCAHALKASRYDICAHCGAPWASANWKPK